MTEIQKIIDKLDISDEIKSVLLSLSKLKTKSKMYTALVLNDLGIKCKMPENDYVLSQIDSALKYGLIGKTDYAEGSEIRGGEAFHTGQKVSFDVTTGPRM